MSKRRKNAGEGYGFMFSGAFAKKADAVAKEKTRKGSFVKGMPTRHGYRYVVMTPRLNPIKRRKNLFGFGKKVKGMSRYQVGDLVKVHFERRGEAEAIWVKITKARGSHYSGTLDNEPVVIRGHLGSRVSFSESQISDRYNPNPTELLVMGANPHTHEVTANKGDTITIRVNPAAVNPATCGAMVQGYPCTRKPGHRGPHLPQGATLRPRSRHKWGPRGNPSAEALRESFTGSEVDRVTVHREGHMPAGNYALLGKLLALYVKPLAGGQVQVIKPTGTQVVADESARQLWFVGGDQDISGALSVFGARERSAGLFELGQATRIDYKQRKEHVPDPDVDEWRHEFGEETGERPLVLFDAKHKRLLLEGGAYVVRTEGIVN